MSLFRFALLFICFAIAFPISKAAFAQDSDMVNTSEACVMPRDNSPVDATDERWKYCDIYMRQFAYREKKKELTQMLETRAKNYKASTKSVLDNYEAELQKYYDSLGD